MGYVRGSESPVLSYRKGVIMAKKKHYNKRKKSSLHNEIMNAHSIGKKARRDSHNAGVCQRQVINRERKGYKYLDVWW